MQKAALVLLFNPLTKISLETSPRVGTSGCFANVEVEGEVTKARTMQASDEFYVDF